ncbi:unnamed protein product [Caenorhabditis auriculariae]|uniref:Tyrosine-protein phosphatase domain-containing protein n=1 Tax=Caenorhabditis auriculariae TaxID=2777116 RepID=A0A8S1GSB7_9PELO|nr:unnamed protein product [Caenorhabditis auriculariae]
MPNTGSDTCSSSRKQRKKKSKQGPNRNQREKQHLMEIASSKNPATKTNAKKTKLKKFESVAMFRSFLKEIPKSSTPTSLPPRRRDNKDGMERTMERTAVEEKSGDKKKKIKAVSPTPAPSTMTIVANTNMEVTAKDFKKPPPVQEPNLALEVTAKSYHEKRATKSEDKNKNKKKNKPPSKSAEENKQATKKSSEWVGDKVARKFIENLDHARAEKEYDEIDDSSVPDSSCTQFLENMDKNQDEEVECLDANRVVLEKSTPTQSDYIHASHIVLENFPRKIILTQLPIMTNPINLEDFWRLIFQEKVSLLEIFASNDQDEKHFSQYFPIEKDQFQQHGSMWINNKQTQLGTPSGKPAHLFRLEVLPVGCAEAVFTTVMVNISWPDKRVPTSFKHIISAASDVFTDILDKDTATMCSLKGAGRTGTFLAISVAMYYFVQGVDVNIKEIVLSIRKQRPGAVDNLLQYCYIYTCVSTFILQNTKDAEIRKKLRTIMNTFVTPTQ